MKNLPFERRLAFNDSREGKPHFGLINAPLCAHCIKQNPSAFAGFFADLHIKKYGVLKRD